MGKAAPYLVIHFLIIFYINSEAISILKLSIINSKAKKVGSCVRPSLSIVFFENKYVNDCFMVKSTYYFYNQTLLTQLRQKSICPFEIKQSISVILNIAEICNVFLRKDNKPSRQLL